MKDDNYLSHIYLLDNKPLYFLVFEHVAVVLDNGEWKEIEYDSSMVDLPKISEDLVKEQLKDVISPDDVCKQIVKNRWDKWVEELKVKIAHPKRKVIGWVQYSYIWEYGVQKVEEDDDDQYYAALIKDLMDNGYFLSGAEYQDINLEPVFDDYKYLSTSRRGFADVVARSRGYFNPMDYARYTEYEFIDREKVKVPLDGKYDERELPLIKLSDELYENIYQHLCDFYRDYQEDDTDLPDSSLAMFLYAVNTSEEWTYFPGDIVTIINQSESASEQFLIKGILPISSLEDLNAFLEDDDIHINKFDEKQIQETLEKGKTLLLFLTDTF